MMLEDLFKEEILQHPVITENPYTKGLAFGDIPNHAEVKDFLIQFAIFQRSFAVEPEGDFHFVVKLNLLRDLAVCVPLDPAFGLNGYALGDPACATRETRHCLHQLGRSYGSKNKSIREGARAALRQRVSHGAKEEPASSNPWWHIAEGFRRHNGVYRKEKIPPPLPLVFFEHNLAIVAQYGDCFKETQRRIVAIPDFQITGWRQGAKMALDAIYLFWKGLEERRKKLR